jgi:uncharacterized delta-60 repeat protein
MWLFDMSFDSWSWFNRDVYTTAIQSDGKILVGGIFQTYDTTPANRIIRLNPNWSIDNTFNIWNWFDNNRINKILIQNDGKILVWGSFTWYNWTTANRIIRLNDDGSRDYSFNIWSGFSRYVHDIATQDDGKILVWWDFSDYQLFFYDKIIRLNSDWSIDNTFEDNNLFFSSYPVNTIAIQNDGKILVGGNFFEWTYVQTNRIIRLNSTGSWDTSFNIWAWFNNNVEKILIQNDGKILVWGSFTWYNWTSANRIIRLNIDWSIDNAFDIWNWFNWTVNTLNIQNDGKILVWGSFTWYNWTTANRIIRLNIDWSIDNTFYIWNWFNTWFLLNVEVTDINIQTNGNIIVWGTFQNFNGNTSKWIVRLSEYNNNQFFRYTVQDWDQSSDLDYLNTWSLILSWWEIINYVWNIWIPYLPSPWWEWSLWFNKNIIISMVDTTKPTCTFTYDPPSATSWNVTATCTPSETVTFQNPVWTGIYTFTGNWSYIFNFTDTAWNTWTATATVNWIDKTAPTFTFNNASVNEAQALTMQITNPNDIWIWLHTSWYNFSYDWISWIGRQASTSFSLWTQNEPTTTGLRAKVRDSLWNESSPTLATWSRTNVAPTVSYTYNSPVLVDNSITWTWTASDPWWSTFTYQRYYNDSCSTPIAWQTLRTTTATLSSAWTTGRYIQAFDAQWSWSNCTWAIWIWINEPNYCWNSILNTWEQCDDWNTINWDGCSSTCQAEIPTCTINATPLSWAIPLSVTFSWSKNSRANYILNFGNWSSTWLFNLPLTHIYTNTWTFNYHLIWTNPWISLPNWEYHETIRWWWSGIDIANWITTDENWNTYIAWYFWW